MGNLAMYNPAIKSQFIEDFKSGKLPEEDMRSYKQDVYSKVIEDIFLLSAKVEAKYDTDISLMKFNQQAEDLFLALHDDRSYFFADLTLIKGYIEWCTRNGYISYAEARINPLHKRYYAPGLILLKPLFETPFVKDAQMLYETLESSLQPDYMDSADVKTKSIFYAGYIGVKASILKNLRISAIDVSKKTLAGIPVPHQFMRTLAHYSQMKGEIRVLNGHDKFYSYDFPEYFIRTANGRVATYLETTQRKCNTKFSSWTTRATKRLKHSKYPGLKFEFRYETMFKSFVFNEVTGLWKARKDADCFDILTQVMKDHYVPGARQQRNVADYASYLKAYHPDLLKYLVEKRGRDWRY